LIVPIIWLLKWKYNMMMMMTYILSLRPSWLCVRCNAYFLFVTDEEVYRSCYRSTLFTALRQRCQHIYYTYLSCR